MKNAKRTQSILHSLVRVEASVMLVTVISFFSWNLLNAGFQKNSTISFPETRLAVILHKEPDSISEPDELMLSIADNSMAESSESVIELKSWMINFNEFCPADSKIDQKFEEWMVKMEDWMNLDYLVKK